MAELVVSRPASIPIFCCVVRVGAGKHTVFLVPVRESLSILNTSSKKPVESGHYVSVSEVQQLEELARVSTRTSMDSDSLSGNIPEAPIREQATPDGVPMRSIKHPNCVLVLVFFPVFTFLVSCHVIPPSHRADSHRGGARTLSLGKLANCCLQECRVFRRISCNFRDGPICLAPILDFSRVRGVEHQIRAEGSRAIQHLSLANSLNSHMLIA